MAKITTVYEETNLAGTLVTELKSTDGSGETFTARFYDTKTGDAREPQATTLTFTLNKDTSKAERIRVSSHTTTDGVTTLVIASSGRNLPWYGKGSGSSTGNTHEAGDSIGCVTSVEPFNQLNDWVDGNSSSGANVIRIGDETDSDIVIYAQNADANKPFLEYDSTTSAWVYSNDGSASAAIGGGANTYTEGDGIDITASVISVVLETGGGLEFNVSGELKASASGDATESSTGGSELATLTEQGTQAETGSDGPLVIQAKNTLKAHATYTPAYLTGGGSATSTVATWIGVSDGTFTITIDGVARSASIDFTPLDGTATMADIASYIQTAIRALTTSTETCTWDTDHFIISSVDTTSSSAITVTSATGAGTDISGAGATAYMDSDTGSGTVTNAVMDKTVNENKVPVLNASGELDDNMIEQNFALKSTLSAKGSIYGASAASTPAERAVGTDTHKLVADSAQASGLAWVPSYRLKVGIITRDLTAATGTVETTGIGFKPDYIEFHALYASGSGSSTDGDLSWAHGAYDGSTSSCIYSYYDEVNGFSNGNSTNDCIVFIDGTTSAQQVADVSATSSDSFTLNWTKTGSPAGLAGTFYKAFKFTA